MIKDSVFKDELSTYLSNCKGGACLRRTHNNKKTRNSFLKETMVEQRKFRGEQETDHSSSSSGLGTRTPTKEHLKKRYVINVLGNELQFVSNFESAGENNPAKTIQYDVNKRLLHIITNIDFPFYKKVTNKRWYILTHIAEGIAEYLTESMQENYASFNSIKDIILRCVSRFDY